MTWEDAERDGRAMNADGGQETRLPFNRPGRSVVAADWGRT